MNRGTLWLVWCVALLACKPRMRVEGDVSLFSEKLARVDVQFVPADAMKVYLAEREQQGKFGLSEFNPPARVSVTSEVDGSFYADVPPGEYAVFAQGTRRKERHHWLLRRSVDLNKLMPPLTLTAENRVGSGCLECIAIKSEPPAMVEPERSTPALNPVVTMASASELVVMGSLDRQLIHQVLKRNRGQIRYCYESQLARAPTLAGKVTVKFVIAPTGEVTTATISQSTVGDASMEACIARRVQAWVFPKPKSGGVVVVTCPFTFALGDG